MNFNLNQQYIAPTTTETVKLIGYDDDEEDNKLTTGNVQLIDHDDLQKVNYFKEQLQELQCESECSMKRIQNSKDGQYIIGVLTNMFLIFCSFLFVLFLGELTIGVLFFFGAIFMISGYLVFRLMFPFGIY